MNQSQHQVHVVVRALLEAVEVGGQGGMRVSDAFMAVKVHVQGIGSFQSLSNCLVLAGSLAQIGDRLFSTSSGTSLLADLRAHLQCEQPAN